MRVYIAGSFAQRERLAAVAGQIEFAGHEVTSTWLHEPKFEELTDWVMRACANNSFLDLERADALLLFTDVPSTTGGFHAELGMALTARKPVYMHGPRSNVFTYMSAVRPPLPWMSSAIDYVDAQIARREAGLVLLHDRRNSDFE